METPDILLIGAGIIGCSLARELARAGQKILILERGAAGEGASSVAAGLLSPALSTTPMGPLSELCFESAALYESWVQGLREDGSGEVGFCRKGLMEVWIDPEQAAGVGRRVLDGRRPGRPVEMLSEQELCRREPALAAPVAGAAFYPQDALVDAARLTHGVARAAALAGVEIHENEPVYSMTLERDRVTTVHTANASYRPGLVVLTAGAWSGQLLPYPYPPPRVREGTSVPSPLVGEGTCVPSPVVGEGEGGGLTLPTRPVKGQMLLADCRVSPIKTPLQAGPALFVPQPDGRLMLGVTVEEAGFDERVTLDGLRSILTNACAVVPAVGRLPLVRAWAGLRPGTPDELPYMGPLSPVRNLWVSTGHFRKGILLAPVCATLMARSILANRLDDALAPFAPTRRAPSPCPIPPGERVG